MPINPETDSYSWIISQLCRDPNLRGIPIPDTIIVKDAKPNCFIIYNKREKLLRKMDKEPQLKHQLLMKYVIRQASQMKIKQTSNSNPSNTPVYLQVY